MVSLSINSLVFEFCCKTECAKETKLFFSNFYSWCYDTASFSNYILSEGRKRKFFFIDPPDYRNPSKFECNFEIKFDSCSGFLWFGDGKKQMKKVSGNLLYDAKLYRCEQDGFTFFCTSRREPNSVEIIECLRTD